MGCGCLGVAQGAATGYVLLHLVYNASLEVAVEDLGLSLLIFDVLYWNVVEVCIQLGHDDGSSCALILGGVTACAAQINTNQD